MGRCDWFASSCAAANPWTSCLIHVDPTKEAEKRPGVVCVKVRRRQEWQLFALDTQSPSRRNESAQVDVGLEEGHMQATKDVIALRVGSAKSGLSASLLQLHDLGGGDGISA